MLADPTTTTDPVDASTSTWKRISSSSNSSTYRLGSSVVGSDWVDVTIRHAKRGSSAKGQSFYWQRNITLVHYKRDTAIDKVDKLTVSFSANVPEYSVLTPADVLEDINTFTGFLVNGDALKMLTSGSVLAALLNGES